ncbi:hypothetical protein PoB_002150300 [Plakobranchus ocellatus]|uniref:Uncharacterized protein n=1 Tax=Plakobranchus ocellatus TaxID=259542 RepID=A0AAV3ZJK2_9GAST|nr:hypothetical protein PoB_002150300 [Plakobranchus ocellatus]
MDAESGETMNNFRFIPKSEVGVNKLIVEETSREINCLSAIVTGDILEALVPTTNLPRCSQMQFNNGVIEEIPSSEL